METMAKPLLTASYLVSMVLRLALREAEPIPRVVFHNRFDAVEALHRRRAELHPLGFEIFVVWRQSLVSSTPPHRMPCSSSRSRLAAVSLYRNWGRRSSSG